MGEGMKLEFPPSPKYPIGAPQCVTCSRFVSVKDPRTRCLFEYGDYGTVLSCEFECASCSATPEGDDG